MYAATKLLVVSAVATCFLQVFLKNWLSEEPSEILRIHVPLQIGVLGFLRFSYGLLKIVSERHLKPPENCKCHCKIGFQ